MPRKPWQIEEDKQPWFVTWLGFTPKYREVALQDRKLIEEHVMAIMRSFVEKRYEDFHQLTVNKSDTDLIKHDINQAVEHYPYQPSLPPPDQIKNLIWYQWQYDHAHEDFTDMWHAYISFWTEEEGRSALTMTTDILLNRDSRGVRVDVDGIGVP